MEDTHTNIFDLDGHEIVMPGRGIRFTKEWKADHIQPILEMLTGEQSVVDTVYHVLDEAAEMEKGAFSELVTTLRPVLAKLVNVDELIVMAVVDWLQPSTKLEDSLLDDVSPKYFLDPLKWILSEIYPLADLVRMFGGQTGITTPSNSQPANGDGPKKGRRRKK